VTGSRTCTLLGPEGPDAAKAAAEPLDLFLFAGVAGSGGGYRPYFENYTVDASIFEMTFVNLPHRLRLVGW
jgi:hypothetical protein